MPEPSLPSTVAAVDLGSNSFHLVVARPGPGRLDVLDRLREPVRLAAGLEAGGGLSEAARKRALSCLARFGQRLRGLPSTSVRAVGTNTLRRARTARDFLAAAEEALGHPIETISGVEEARLIYLGVARDLHHDAGRRLVIDIGGGSTEVVVGEGSEPLHGQSLYMGCVSWSLAHFAGGRLTAKALERARLAARIELEPLEQPLRDRGWESAVGSSGTVLAIAAILRENGWARSGITREGLLRLRRALLEARRIDALSLPGLSASRAPVLPGGFAILLAAFEALGIEHLETSQGALREGILCDLLGRIAETDARDRTIEGFTRRYHVDLAQADRVERTVAACLRGVAEDWGLSGPVPAKLLGWAARLHEVGLTVAHAGYHKHGAYLVEHSEMPGFSRGDQQALGALIRFHRRKILRPALPATGTPLRPKSLLRACALLRVAVRLNRSRSREPPPQLRLRARKSSLHLEFPEGWLEARPLTRADLQDEAAALAAAGIELTFR